MKLGIISDLHIDINSEYPVIDELINRINDKHIDVLLVAGDISEKVRLTLEAIDKLKSNTSAQIYFVPGNHDMWGKDYPAHSTAKIYDTYKNHPACISEKLIQLSSDISLFGNVGWYDYSFGTNTKYSPEDFDTMSHDGRTWQDKLFNDWSIQNKTTNEWQIKTLESALEKSHAKINILMTHMVSHEKFTVPPDWSDKIDWGYFNAFLGSRAITDFCSKNKINMAIMGHVHYRGTYTENNTLYICSCLNYHTEWQSQDFSKELDEALFILDL